MNFTKFPEQTKKVFGIVVTLACTTNKVLYFDRVSQLGAKYCVVITLKKPTSKVYIYFLAPVKYKAERILYFNAHLLHFGFSVVFFNLLVKCICTTGTEY